MTTIRRALISVSDKTGVLDLARALKSFDVENLSTGGTARLLADNGVPVVEVSDYTGFPEVLGVGYETITDMLQNHLGVGLLVTLLLLKLLATGVTIGSGGSGHHPCELTEPASHVKNPHLVLDIHRFERRFIEQIVRLFGFAAGAEQIGERDVDDHGLGMSGHRLQRLAIGRLGTFAIREGLLSLAEPVAH